MFKICFCLLLVLKVDAGIRLGPSRDTLMLNAVTTARNVYETAKLHSKGTNTSRSAIKKDAGR
jgi:hypothetical protein